MNALRRVILSPFGGAGMEGTPVMLANLATRAQETRVAILLMVVGVFSWMDLTFTLFTKSINMLNEMNPIARAYLTSNLGMSFVCYKLLMVIAGTTMLWRVRRSAWAVPACWILVAAHVALGVVWWLWVRDIVKVYEIILG